MRIAIRSPDPGHRQQLVEVLGAEPDFDIVDEQLEPHDIVLIDADLMEGDGRSMQPLRTGVNAVVVFAPQDPDRLARFLAAGARGYHCAGEPWRRLTETMHQVLAGEVRSDPQVMSRLLHLYRYLRREFISQRLHESC